MYERDIDFNKVTLFANHQGIWTGRFKQALTEAGFEVGIVRVAAESLNGDVLNSSLFFQVRNPLSSQFSLLEQAASLGGRAIVIGNEPGGESEASAILHGAVAYFERSVDFRSLIDYLRDPNKRALWVVRQLNERISSSNYRAINRAINPGNPPGHVDG